MTSKKLSKQEIDNLTKMLNIYLKPVKGDAKIIDPPMVLYVKSRDASGNIIEEETKFYYEIKISNDIKELHYSEVIDLPLSGIAWLIAYNVWCDLEGNKSGLDQTIFDKDLILGMRQYD